MDKDELLQLVAARLVPVAHGETGDDGLASARDTHGSTAETRDKKSAGVVVAAGSGRRRPARPQGTRDEGRRAN